MKGLLLFAALLPGAVTAAPHDDTRTFSELFAVSDQLTNLTAPGAKPFHWKLHAAGVKNDHPEFAADIELWWAAPVRWRRQITSSAFSQTAVQNGEHYSESNSSDYLPWWLHELITEPLRPLPMEEVANVNFPGQARRCAEWESKFALGADSVGIHNSICFNSDGTVREAFSRTSGAEFFSYMAFGNKRVPSRIGLWAEPPDRRSVQLEARVTVLEELHDDPALFVVTKDTGLSARTRFVPVLQSALETHKLDAAPMQWPVVHNFPASGMMAINIKIDRDGTVREVESPISKNVVLNDAAVEQIKKWKFKPYLVDGVAVQVTADFGIHFDAKMELLGSNGESLPALPFLSRIQKCRELSELRLEGGKPFHLHALIQYADGAQGAYDELWQSPTKWKREATLGNITVAESQSGDLNYRKVTGSEFSPRQVDAFLDELKGHFPRTDGSFIEGDWGQSAVQFRGASVVRVARGEVDANNQPTTGQAYWFDSGGLLQGAFVAPTTSAYSDFSDWNGKQVPRKIEVTQKGELVMRVSIDSLADPAAPLEDAAFVLPGVHPQKPAADEYQGPAVVPATPIHEVKPVDPHAGHGTVVLEVKLDEHGHVRTVEIIQSAGKALDEAAARAALQWEFTPMRIRGQIVAAFARLEFKF